MGRGTDYGRGATNIDPDNGIRYGVIYQNEVLQAWCDSSEPDYGPPTCGKCGNEAATPETVVFADDIEPEWYNATRDYHCLHCERSFDSDDAYCEEPLSHYLDDGEYHATCGSDGDIFITKSPYYTRASFCSPCAPGACNLMSPCEDGDKAYCFGHDWFDDGKAPYPVYRVTDDTLVEPD
jgi:hypothetical protein